DRCGDDRRDRWRSQTRQSIISRLTFCAWLLSRSARSLRPPLSVEMSKVEDAAGVDTNQAVQFVDTASVAHQAACRTKLAIRRYCRVRGRLADAQGVLPSLSPGRGRTGGLRSRRTVRGAQVLPPARATVPPSLRESNSRVSSLPACCALGPARLLLE